MSSLGMKPNRRHGTTNIQGAINVSTLARRGRSICASPLASGGRGLGGAALAGYGAGSGRIAALVRLHLQLRLHSGRGSGSGSNDVRVGAVEHFVYAAAAICYDGGRGGVWRDVCVLVCPMEHFGDLWVCT